MVKKNLAPQTVKEGSELFIRNVLARIKIFLFHQKAHFLYRYLGNNVVLFSDRLKCVFVLHVRLMGSMILALEAPMCCQYVPTLVTVSNWIENHFRFWMRGCLYLM